MVVLGLMVDCGYFWRIVIVMVIRLRFLYEIVGVVYSYWFWFFLRLSFSGFFDVMWEKFLNILLNVLFFEKIEKIYIELIIYNVLLKYCKYL